MYKQQKFGNSVIKYSLKESPDRKNATIKVENREVSLHIPLGTDRETYESIISKKAPWILKQLAEYDEINPRNKELQFISGESLPYLGRYYRLKVTKVNSEIPSLKFLNGKFEATVPEHSKPNEYRILLYPLYKEWIYHKSTLFAEKRIKRFIDRLGQSPKGITLREMEKRWGSCTPQRQILLNWRIFLAPVSIVDYVLAHEIAHLKEMNHTPAYWETLRMLIPDYEERKEWLRLNGNQLYI